MTFGTPEVGNSLFASRLLEFFPQQRHYVLATDLVPVSASIGHAFINIFRPLSGSYAQNPHTLRLPVSFSEKTDIFDPRSIYLHEIKFYIQALKESHTSSLDPKDDQILKL